MRRHVIALLLAPLVLSGCGRGGDLAAVAAHDEFGEAFALAARVCRPAKLPAEIAVLNHGEVSQGGEREALQALGCGDPAVRWFTGHGYLTVLPVRRGYGPSGGDWAEDPGPCGSPDYAHAAAQGAIDAARAVQYARTLPAARPGAVVVAGWDTGGMAALALAGSLPPGSRVVAWAPGAGARGGAAAGHVCRPDLLADAAGQFGRAARAPVLWITAQNDRLYSPELTTAMSAAFVAAGGHATLVMPETELAEGHDLFAAASGPAVWGPLLEQFLDE